MIISCQESIKKHKFYFDWIFMSTLLIFVMHIKCIIITKEIVNILIKIYNITYQLWQNWIII